jgi:hypothetical protein
MQMKASKVIETEKQVNIDTAFYTQGEEAQRSPELSQETSGFSLIAGGPLYQLLLRIGLVKPPLNRLGPRVIVITLFLWGPLLVLAILSGRFVSAVRVPFLYDIEAQIRLLISLPLLIAAELTISGRTRAMLLQFVDRKLISSEVLPKFEGCIHSALWLRNSPFIELGLLAIVILGQKFWWQSVLTMSADTWYATITATGHSLAPAGYWYVFVSIPIVQFFWLRWYFRLFIWARLLWQISRLELNLVPSHPDRCCGLGFLGTVAFAFAPFLLAQSTLLAGYLGNRILYQGATLPNQKMEIVAIALFIYVLTLGPLCVFVPRLLYQREHGLYTYGSLASEYVIGFHKKWIGRGRRTTEELVGSSDIQSLADLANSFSVVEHIRPLPFGREAVITVAAIIALPILPLTLTMFSFQELVSRLLKVLF